MNSHSWSCYFLRRASLAVLLAVLLATSAFCASGRQNYTALDTPAVQTAFATTAAMLAITRAGKRLVAVGERGIILLSDNNGLSWRQARRVPVSTSLTSVQFVTCKTGWAVGHFGVVLRSNDGGETWVQQLDGIEAAKLALADAKRRADDATKMTPSLERSLAEGKRLEAAGPNKPFLSLYFRDAIHGFVFGAFNLAFRTSDGGQHWQSWLSHLDNPRGLHIYGITRAGHSLIIAGEQGLLLRSIDNGQTFTALVKPEKASWFGILTTHSGAVLIFGLVGNVYRSVDRGTSWQHSSSGTQAGISAGMVLRDGDVVLTTNSGEVLISNDDGRSFKRVIALDAPLTGITQASDGNLEVSTMKGVKSLSLSHGDRVAK